MARWEGGGSGSGSKDFLDKIVRDDGLGWYGYGTIAVDRFVKTNTATALISRNLTRSIRTSRALHLLHASP